MRAFFHILLLALMSVSTVSVADELGKLRGTVNFCGQGGVDGMQVYVPGQPYVVITAADGHFQFELPEGRYDLYYRLHDRVLNRNNDVQVREGETTDLSAIVFCDKAIAVPDIPAVESEVTTPAAKACEGAGCQDADGDGAVAAQDCDDNNAKMYPGAVEFCDGLDNNCNGVIDDNVSPSVPHGLGSCEAGHMTVLSCDSGYGDCDGAGSNGCESNLKKDVENCGSCGNACTMVENCLLGVCE
jgi:hypothetical protein